MRSKIGYAALVALSASAAYGEGSFGFDGVMSFSLSNAEMMGVSSNQATYNFVSHAKFSEKFSLGLDLDYGNLKAGGETVTSKRFQLAPTFSFGNGSYAGAYFQDTSLQVSVIGVGLQGFGAFAGHDAGKWAIDGYVGSTGLNLGSTATAGDDDLQDDPTASLDPSISTQNFGVTATFRPADNLEVYGHFSRGDLSIGPVSGNISVTALGAEYNFQNGLMAYGAFERFSILGQADLDGISIGAGYDLSSSGANIPGTLTVEFGRTDLGVDLEGDDLEGAPSIKQTQVTIGWLIPLGNSDVKPLNSTSRAARGGIRGPIAIGTGTLGLGGIVGAVVELSSTPPAPV
jgi:hypothetical protein